MTWQRHHRYSGNEPDGTIKLMAAYLPYCSRFVTADRKQETRLREIAVEAKVDCEVVSYTEFLASLVV